jgi:N6-adenosine-specific RNA methylase IME4
MTAPVSLPELSSLGEFDIVVADPPWRPDFGRSCSRSVTKHYEVMSLDAICELRPPAARDALLVLWTPAPMLTQALCVMDAWGFTYRTHGVWCKTGPAGTGKWLRAGHELYLLGRRGRFPAPLPGTLPLGVIHAPRRGHSVKPEELQDAIEATYPGRRYLEMFARRPRPGWTVWGLEVPAA